jgi:hypothetical protein
MVLVDQLTVLCDALDDPGSRERTQRWFVGRCLDIAELAALVHERIAQIHAIWMPYRQDQPPRPGMTEADRSSFYRTAIRVAQRALCELRDEPELASFLDNGVTAADLPEVHQACKRIDVVLGLQLDSEAGRLTGRKQRRSRTPNGVPERP